MEKNTLAYEAQLLRTLADRIETVKTNDKEAVAEALKKLSTIRFLLEIAEAEEKEEA